MQDLGVRLAHAVPPHPAHIGDRLLGIVAGNSLTGAERITAALRDRPPQQPAAILAAQDGFAPSHTIPPTLQRVLLITLPRIASSAPCRNAMPQTAPTAAHTAPQKADKFPMYRFCSSAIRLASASAR